MKREYVEINLEAQDIDTFEEYWNDVIHDCSPQDGWDKHGLEIVQTRILKAIKNQGTKVAFTRDEVHFIYFTMQHYRNNGFQNESLKWNDNEAIQRIFDTVGKGYFNINN